MNNPEFQRQHGKSFYHDVLELIVIKYYILSFTKDEFGHLKSEFGQSNTIISKSRWFDEIKL